LAGLGSVWFLIASSGGLAISSVITSLYPAFTVLLAFVLLRERVRHVQAVGLVLAAASVVLVTV
jgi:drug/metabolite transporter (DMT)-like permease